MDLSNLTFDELLEAIRSDSGYQTTQARKVSAIEVDISEKEPLKEEPKSNDAEDMITDTATLSNDTSDSAFEPLAIEDNEETFAEPENSDISSFSEIPHISIDNENTVFTVDNEPIITAEDNKTSDINSFFGITDNEKAPIFSDSPEQVPFYEPVSLAEEDEYEAESLEIEPSIAFEPMQFAQPTDKKQEEQTAQTVQKEPEPIELVFPEEDEDEEPIKIYTPPKPEPIDFGGFNISADIASLFPDIGDESEYQPVTQDESEYLLATEADDKTRIIEPVTEQKPEETFDKTRVVESVADDKTKAVPYTPVFERPGIVTTSSAYDKTSDLNALPHILPADELIGNEPKTFVRTGEIPKISSQPKPPVVRHEEEEQMVLPGFFEIEEVVRVNENEVEEELKRTRSRKVDSFKLEGADIEEPSMDPEVSQELAQGNSEAKRRRFSLTKTRHRLSKQKFEFTKPSDARKIHDFIARKKLISLISTIVTGVCAFVLLITTAIPAVADKINSGTSGINGAPTTYLISLIFLCVSFAAALPTCISGITCFFTGSGRPNSQTAVVLAAVAALLQNISAISAYNGEEFPIFALAAVFLLCCCSAGNILVHTRTMSNFAFLFKQGKEGMYSVRSIDNAIDANRVSQNVVMGDADIRYSGKLKFATRFMSYSLSSDSSDDLCAKLVPIAVAVSVLIGIIAGIVTKSFVGGFSLFTGALCMATPACAIIASNLPLLIENKKLHKDGAMVTSYAAAFEYESTNAIALDASDLFPGESCNIHGMKTFNGVRVDDAVLTAASMLIAAGGPISSLFENVIMEHNELLLKVEELKYEERLGLSGWIRGRRIFVGNRKLLENHNIEIPMSVDESKYIRGDRQIIYLADAGKIAAFFVVSYGRNKKIAEYLRRIENNGINILVRTTDSNINEKFIARCFDLPLNSVKVVSNTAGEVLRNYAEHTVAREDAKLIHNGTAAAFLHAVSSASKLCATAGKTSSLQTFSMAAGLFLTVLIMIFSGPLTLTALPVCVCQILWIAIAAILPLLGKE